MNCHHESEVYVGNGEVGSWCSVWKRVVTVDQSCSRFNAKVTGKDMDSPHWVDPATLLDKF